MADPLAEYLRYDKRFCLNRRETLVFASVFVPIHEDSVDKTLDPINYLANTVVQHSLRDLRYANNDSHHHDLEI
jgi:hypothetical protein